MLHLFSLNRLINSVMKQGSATANTLGVLAVMYSGFGVLISWGRGSDDELNTLAAATATGLLYKSTGESQLLKAPGLMASLGSFLIRWWLCSQQEIPCFCGTQRIC
jgi:import inner membrane translocase subunit TIM23